MFTGSKILYNDLFPESAPPPKQKKGRSVELHARRNECLVDRYYFYASQKLNNGTRSLYSYHAIIELLQLEFFLSPITIPEVIADNMLLLSKLKKEQPPLSYFKKKWPHLVWETAKVA